MYVEMFGPKVRALRESEGADVPALAGKASISPTTLRRVEGNRGTVRLKTARKIASALDVGALRELGRPA